MEQKLKYFGHFKHHSDVDKTVMESVVARRRSMANCNIGVDTTVMEFVVDGRRGIQQ